MFGKKGFIKLLGIMSERTHCEQCQKDERFQIIYKWNWYVIFFIPVFPLGKQYYLDCPLCGYRTEITKKEARAYLDIAAKERKNHTKKRK